MIDAVIDESTRIIENAPKIMYTLNSWTALQLTAGEQIALAESAHILRFDDSDGKVDTPITSAQLLQPRRNHDTGPDL